ncbi:hypothetical protein [Photobacterium sp. Hal280]|uniref:hypothetical protein n=1 Tax=Photobacterium sp. Hal280 TaxID=3035163 RepID=UPI00301C163C
MSSYNLNINIDSNDVRTINQSQQKVVLVKTVGGSSGSKVAWVTFSPFEHNEVSWTEKYGVYASSTQVQSGAQIYKTSAVNPATTEVMYPFEDGTFGSPENGGQSNSYGISNRYSQGFTFGLAQSVVANGNVFEASPLNAVSVLSRQNAIFTPVERLEVFLQGNFNNGVVISQVSSTALPLDFTNNSDITIRYDSSLGRFVIA